LTAEIVTVGEPAIADSRPSREVGRRARLELVFSARRGRTILAHAYAEPPFRVGRPFEHPSGVDMILPWAAPGIFGGDALEQRVRVERGARVRLRSQSALQVHPAPGKETATMRTIYAVEEGGSLACDWDPLIPFASSRFVQRIDLQVAAGATLFWSDAFMSGREGRGERWRFDTFDHELALAHAGERRYLERYRLEPAAGDPSAPWMASAACYFGTTLLSGRLPGCSLSDLQGALNALGGVQAAADALADDLALVRLMGWNGSAFHRARALAGASLCP
jgi:urease accessory protein